MLEKQTSSFLGYDNINQQLYMLDFVTPILRKNVQTALNRGESYHQLRVRFLRQFWQLRFRSEDDHSSGIV